MSGQQIVIAVAIVALALGWCWKQYLNHKYPDYAIRNAKIEAQRSREFFEREARPDPEEEKKT